MKGETLVHAPLLLSPILLSPPAPPWRRPPQLLGSQQSLCIFPGAVRQTSKTRRLFFSKPFRCRWVEDDIVYGLYQLQLDYAFHLLDNMIYVQLDLIKLISFACKCHSVSELTDRTEKRRCWSAWLAGWFCGGVECLWLWCLRGVVVT